MTGWLRRVWYLLNRRRYERELEREMAAHRAQMTDPRRFGSPLRLREEARDAWGWTWLDDLRQDVRHGVRTLARTPAFTLTTVLTLALGIGVTTALFSLMRAVLLDPLPFPDASRLMTVWVDGTRRGMPAEIEATPALFFEWQSENTVFERMAAFDFRDVSLTGAGEPARLRGYQVMHDLFGVLRVQPMLGRAFRADDNEPGRTAVAILAHPVWQSRFGSSRAVIGRQILLDDQPYTVVGVMPPGFDFPARGTQIWTPYPITPEARANRGAYNLTVVARLRDGVTLAQAREAMDALTGRLVADAPERLQIGARVTPLRDRLVGDTRSAVLVLFALAASVLLLATANLANLVLARAVTQHGDTTLRLALGAGRGRLIRHRLTEHLLLSGAGAVLGVLIAAAAAGWLSNLLPENLTSARLAFDLRLLLFAVGLCVATTLALGTLPSRLAWRARLGDALRGTGARAGDSRRAQRLRSSLLVAQAGFAVVLLIAAGLFVQTYLRLSRVDPGFAGERVLSLRTDLPVPRYADPVRRSAFYRDVLERIDALPGVSEAGYTTFLPFVFGGLATILELEGRPEPSAQPAGVRLVTPGYLAAMGMRLLRGRVLNEGDRLETEPVVVINETMATLFWPGIDAMGQRFRPFGCRDAAADPAGDRPNCRWLRVAGIVHDVHQAGLRAAPRPEYYQSFVQIPRPAELPPFIAPKDLAIRATGDPGLLVDAVRQAIWSVDPEQAIAQVRVMSEYVEEDLAPDRLQAQLITAFAALALLLASLGVYGVLTYTLAQRRRELGLRSALGAQQSELVRWVVRGGVQPVAAGLVIGVATAYGLAHFVAGLLYDVRARDPLTFGLAAVTLFAVAVAACWLPAHRAARVDPFAVLRSE